MDDMGGNFRNNFKKKKDILLIPNDTVERWIFVMLFVIAVGRGSNLKYSDSGQHKVIEETRVKRLITTKQGNKVKRKHGKNEEFFKMQQERMCQGFRLNIEFPW